MFSWLKINKQWIFIKVVRLKPDQPNQWLRACIQLRVIRGDITVFKIAVSHHPFCENFSVNCLKYFALFLTTQLTLYSYMYTYNNMKYTELNVEIQWNLINAATLGTKITGSVNEVTLLLKTSLMWPNK